MRGFIPRRSDGLNGLKDARLATNIQLLPELVPRLADVLLQTPAFSVLIVQKLISFLAVGNLEVLSVPKQFLSHEAD